jgi:hypothetical protein
LPTAIAWRLSKSPSSIAGSAPSASALVALRDQLAQLRPWRRRTKPQEADILCQAEARHHPAGKRAALQELVLRVVESGVVRLDRIAALEFADQLGLAVDLDGRRGAVDGSRQEAVEEAEREDDDRDAGHQPAVLHDDGEIAQQVDPELVDLLLGKAWLKGPSSLAVGRRLGRASRPHGRHPRLPRIVRGWLVRLVCHRRSFASLRQPRCLASGGRNLRITEAG